ncbi:MAG: hypothetical protein E5Y31_20980 [Mesorhizobium sp.]|nr:MAG: hypothetical protein E5Y31_20980 [Mesorhizobium sp.]
MSARLGCSASEQHPDLTSQAKIVDSVAAPVAANDDTKTHDDVLRGNAGIFQNAAVFVDRLLADAEIEHQSRIIARKLEEAGWNPYLKHGDDVVLIGTVTGAIQRGNHFRNTNIIPIVAKRNRAEILGEFKLFLKENRAARRYSRYAVVSSGARFDLGELPARYAVFSDLLGRFLEEAKALGNLVYLVTVEMTFDEVGAVNLHANIVYRPMSVFGSGKWAEWLASCREHFGTSFFHDAGKLKNPDEIIKYVCKPGEILGVTSDQTRFLAETLHGKQLVRPVGEFSAWRKDLRAAGQKVRFDHAAGKLIRVRRFTREQMIQNEIEQENREAGRVERMQKAKHEGKYREQEDDPVIENQILCTTLPQARASLLAETFVVIRNYTPTPTTEGGRAGLKALEAKRAFYVKLLVEEDVGAEAAKRASSILDTSTMIPEAVAREFHELDEKRRTRILRGLGISSPNVNLGDLKRRIRLKLNRLLPKERHPWGENSADIEKLYAAALERHQAWVAAYESGYEDEAAYLDDVIPYDLPLSPVVLQMREDTAASAARYAALFDQDEVNARLSENCAVRSALAAAKKARRKAARRQPATPSTPWIAPWIGWRERLAASSAQKAA